MCPFLDDEEEEYEDYNDMIKQEEEKTSRKVSIFKDDRKFFAIGGIASVIAFCSIAYFLYSNSKPVDLDDLPVIQADVTPIKIKAANNPQVNHQDKIVYDNISGEKRKTEEEHIINQPEEILSINEVDSGGVLSEEEKQKIINAFDELAPEKEYKIQYIKNGNVNTSNNAANTLSSISNASRNAKQNNIIENGNMKIVEGGEEILPPIKRIDNQKANQKNIAKKNKAKLSDLIDQKISENSVIGANSIEASSRGGNVMVQIASLPTKSGAEVEYRRLANKNKFIRHFGKRIYKVDLGKPKGNTYRLQIGPFKNNAEAHRIISALKNNGCAAYISR